MPFNFSSHHIEEARVNPAKAGEVKLILFFKLLLLTKYVLLSAHP